MNRCAKLGGFPRRHVPRERGDEPGTPATRHSTFLMFPASAGMNRSDNELITHAKHVPRERGDEPGKIQSFKEWIMMFPASAGMNRG